MGQYVSAALSAQSRQFAGWQRRTISSPNFATIQPQPKESDAGPHRLVHPSRSMLQMTRQEDIIIYSLPRAFVEHCAIVSSSREPASDVIFIVTGSADSWQLVATPLDRCDALRESEYALNSDIHWGPCFRADPTNIIVMCPASIASPALDLVCAPHAAQVITRTHELRVRLSLAYRSRAIARVVAFLPTYFVIPMFPRPTTECVLDFISGPRGGSFAALEQCKVNISGYIMRYIIAASCATHKCNSWETLPRERLEIAALAILSVIVNAAGENAQRCVVIFPACFRDVCKYEGDRMPALFFINHRA